MRRHPELMLELEVNRSVKRHQRELAAAFAKARRDNDNRWAAMRREFPVRHRPHFLHFPSGQRSTIYGDPLHMHSGSGGAGD